MEQVEALLRKHEAFQKVVDNQGEKLEAITQQGNTLVDSKHFEAPMIKKTVQEVTARRKNIQDQSNRKQNSLADSLLYQQFCRDESEVMSPACLPPCLPAQQPAYLAICLPTCLPSYLHASMSTHLPA